MTIIYDEQLSKLHSDKDYYKFWELVEYTIIKKIKVDTSYLINDECIEVFGKIIKKATKRKNPILNIFRYAKLIKTTIDIEKEKKELIEIARENFHKNLDETVKQMESKKKKYVEIELLKRDMKNNFNNEIKSFDKIEKVTNYLIIDRKKVPVESGHLFDLGKVFIFYKENKKSGLQKLHNKYYIIDYKTSNLKNFHFSIFNSIDAFIDKEIIKKLPHSIRIAKNLARQEIQSTAKEHLWYPVGNPIKKKSLIKINETKSYKSNYGISVIKAQEIVPELVEEDHKNILAFSSLLSDIIKNSYSKTQLIAGKNTFYLNDFLKYRGLSKTGPNQENVKQSLLNLFKIKIKYVKNGKDGKVISYDRILSHLSFKKVKRKNSVTFTTTEWYINFLKNKFSGLQLYPKAIFKLRGNTYYLAVYLLTQSLPTNQSEDKHKIIKRSMITLLKNSKLMESDYYYFRPDMAETQIKESLDTIKKNNIIIDYKIDKKNMIEIKFFTEWN